LNASWSAVALQGEKITILFDTDRRTNPTVALAEARLAIALEAKGANVFTANIPSAENKLGPDDLLSQPEGARKLHDVVSAAEPADPLERAKKYRVLAETDRKEARHQAAHLLTDTPFLAAVRERGATTESLATLALSGLITKKQLGSALTKFSRELSLETNKTRAATTLLGHYLEQGSIWRRPEGKEPQSTCLTNFTAEIVHQTALDDGVEQIRMFGLKGQLRNGEALPLIEVSAHDFDSSQWISKSWGSGAHVSASAGGMAHVRCAIKEFSTTTKQKHVYAHTGWRKIDGVWKFLHAGGAVGPGDAVDVRLDLGLSHYTLPPASDPETLRAAVRSALGFIEIAPERITLPIFCAVFRSVLNHFIFCDAAVWLHGRTGVLKSSIAAAAMQFFGADFARETLGASWHDTYAALERRNFVVADALVTIDDFAPKSSENTDELRKKAALVIRGLGNRSNRNRMTSNLGVREARPPRALVLSTGEDTPDGESIQARCFPIAIQKGDVNLDKLTPVQESRDASLAMRGFIEFLQIRLSKDEKGLRERLQSNFRARRASFTRQGHLRTPAAAAHLWLGGSLFCEFAQEVGALTKQEAENLETRITAALTTQMELQNATATNENPVDLFFRTLRSLLASGEATVEQSHVELVPTPGNATIGWRATTAKDGSDKGSEDFHLLPEATYRAVTKALTLSREHIPIKQHTLWERALEAGYLRRGSDSTRPHTTQKRHGSGSPKKKGKPVWVIVMPANTHGEAAGDTLEGDESDPCHQSKVTA
jgi:DNA polymerase-1